MVAILIGLLFLFGIISAKNLLTQTCKAQKALSQKDIMDAISDYNSKDSAHTESIILSCDYTEICFLDAERLKTNSPPITNIPYKVMQDVVTIQGDYNIFFVKGDVVEPIGFSNKLTVEGDGSLCVTSTGNSFKIIFVGKGRTTAVRTS